MFFLICLQSLRRPLHYAIVDEVDSILIDEARNPFIINASDAVVDATPSWRAAVRIAQRLKGPPLEEMVEDEARDEGRGPRESHLYDFIPDYRGKGATLTQRGMRRVLRALASPDMERLILAVPQKAKTVENVQQTVLHAVLLHRSNDGQQLVLTARPVDLSNDDQVEAIKTDAQHTVITVRDRTDVVPTLRTALGLRPLSIEETTDALWSAAAPAVLWTGGDRAWGRFVTQAVRAVHLYQRDVDYIVKDGDVIIIDSATGRERRRSRWQAGIHQALEAKEESQGTSIRPEDYDRGRVTYQSLFRSYQRLSGMTGTASTEAEEFADAYGLRVVRVPPHRPSKRIDHSPEVFVSRVGWEQRLRELVAAAVAGERPVLLGTSSVEESEAVRDLVSSIPFRADLQSRDVVRLGTALQVLPSSLVPVLPMAVLHEQLSATEYAFLCQGYEYAISVARRVHAVGRLTPELGLDVQTAVSYLRILRRVVSDSQAATDEPSPAIIDSLVNVIDVLSQTLARSVLGNHSRPINLLNARPDRARREAETIAQAGLPGTVTVATAMAGRGTDILLGGNPKGLTGMALQRLVTPMLVGPDVIGPHDEQEAPLAGLSHAFDSTADMALHLPPPLYQAWLQVVQAMAPASPHPTFGTAPEASAFLRRLLEGVEVDRSLYFLDCSRRGLAPSLESAAEWSHRISTLDCNKHNSSIVALHRYALLQWLWFDGECEKFAAQVRAAGGLEVVITSLQDTRRTELQLRGRAGRQGDPGETYMVSSRDDPSLRAVLAPAQLSRLWAYVESTSEGNEQLPAPLVAPVLREVTRGAEHLGQSARDTTRKYDAVIDPYRRHIYRLRRTLVGGGDAVRATLIHRHLRGLAQGMASTWIQDPGQPVDTWQIEELLGAVESLFSDGMDAAVGSTTPLQEGARMEEGGAENSLLWLRLHLKTLAPLVREALKRNTQLPDPWEVLWLTPHGDSGSTPFGSGSVPGTQQQLHPIPVRRRSCLLAARRLPKASTLFSTAFNNPPMLSRLGDWLGDFLAMAYERRRNGLIDVARRRFAECNAHQAASVVRLVERDVLLECLDDLWADYLQDLTVLQRATATRAFSNFDALDEFRLEASRSFARLLLNFSQQAAVAALGPVHIRALGHYQALTATAQTEGGNRRLNDVAWAAELGKESVPWVDWGFTGEKSRMG